MIIRVNLFQTLPEAGGKFFQNRLHDSVEFTYGCGVNLKHGKNKTELKYSRNEYACV